MSQLIKTINKSLGPHCHSYVCDFLEKNKSSLKNITLSSQLNTIGNYIYLLGNGNYINLLNTNWDSLYSEYCDFVNNYKKNHTTENYTESNKIIWDGRVNGLGFYWVDLEKEFCIESMVRMDDCGRVNYGNTTLELREQTKTLNNSHMIVVYEISSGNIKQIKGKQNSKPNDIYQEYLYELIMNTDYTFNKYVPTYKPENDLLISELPLKLRTHIYEKYPKLIKLKTLM